MSKRDELRERALQKLQRFKDSLEPRHEIIWGLLGDAEGTVSVPGQAGKSYCRLFGISTYLVRAWNASTSLVPNLRVDVEVERQEGMPDDYIVLGVSKVGYSGYVNQPRDYVSPHHETHEYSPGEGGYDIVNVYNRALAELRADSQATPDMTLRISAGLYLTETTMVVRDRADSPAFTAAPGAGLIRYDLLYLDTADSQYKITEGTAAVPAMASKPLPTDGQIPIAWVLFEAGDTAITYTMITDARILYLPIGALGVGDHALLSVPHTDTLADDVVDGDVLIGNVTPAWSRLAIAVPAANVRNVLGIDNTELRPSWKTALDATDPADIAGAASPGTSLIFSHRDHVHAHPAGLGVDLHHTQIHDIIGGDHTVTGAKWNVVACIAIDTVGLFLALADVSAGAGVEAILKSDATGGLILQRLDTDTMGLPNGNAFPGAPNDGDVFYRTDEDILYIYDGAAWTTVSVIGDHPLDPSAVDAVHTGTLKGLHAHADNENKSGECNGIKTVFLTAQEFSQEGLHVHLNGQLLTLNDDYTEGAFYDAFTMAVAPIAGDKLMLSYVAEWA